MLFAENLCFKEIMNQNSSRRFRRRSSLVFRSPKIYGVFLLFEELRQGGKIVPARELAQRRRTQKHQFL